jgi:hypothetical protein
MGDFGWLSPEGVFYRCDVFGHESLARDLCSSGVEFEWKGWVHIEPYYLDFGPKNPTRAQKDFVLEFCLAHGLGEPAWLDA